MKNFMKTILSGVQAWTRGEIRKSTADWNQNDQNADNYIKNRTHWEEKVTKEESFMIAKEFDLSEEGYLEWANIPILTAGQKYVVDWNGERYECLAKLDSYGETVYLGNPHLGEWYENPASSEPFFIATFSKDQWSMICCEPGIYTVEILLPAGRTIIHKLDKKFLDLPENLATIDDVEEALDYINEDIENKVNFYNPCAEGSFTMNQGSASGNSFSLGECCISNGDGAASLGRYNAIKYSSQKKEYSSEKSYSSFGEGFAFCKEFSFNENTGQYILKDPIVVKYTGEQPANHSPWYVQPIGSTNKICKWNGRTGWITGSDTISWIYYQEEWYPEALAFMFGNGTSNTARSNAHTLDWEGNAWYSGDVYVGSTSGTNRDEGSKKLATEDSVRGILIETGLITPEDIDAICGVTT